MRQPVDTGRRENPLAPERLERVLLVGTRRAGGDKLIVIAMDSGFASLSSFNRVFQSVQGMTPGAYRRALQSREADGGVRSQVAGF